MVVVTEADVLAQLDERHCSSQLALGNALLQGLCRYVKPGAPLLAVLALVLTRVAHAHDLAPSQLQRAVEVAWAYSDGLERRAREGMS